MNDLIWFGYTSHVRALKDVTEECLKRTVKPIRDAAEGLEVISKEDPALILFNAPTPVGGLTLPENVYLRDWVSTDCHVIERIREIKPKTPVIVTHVSVFPGYSLGNALAKYRKAGATDLVDSGAKFEEFADFLRKYLPVPNTSQR